MINVQDDGFLESAINQHQQRVAENIDEISNETTQRLDYLFRRNINDEEGAVADVALIQKTTYRSSESALEEIDKQLNQSSKIALEGSGILPEDNQALEAVNTLEDYQNITRILNDWLSAKIDPETLLTRMQSVSGKLHNASSIEYQEALHYAESISSKAIRMLTDGYGIEQKNNWAQLDVDDKMALINDLNIEHTGLNGFLVDLEEKAKAFDAILKNINEHIEKSGRKSDIFGEDTESIINSSQKLWDRIEWASPLEMYNGIKMWWEATKRSWNQYSDQRAAEFAKQFGKLGGMMPSKAMQDSRDILNEDVSKKQKEIRNNYLEFYKSDGPTYKQVFGNGGLYEKSKDTQRRLALLLYAAENGWLYGIESGNIYTPLGGKIVFAELVGTDEGALAFFADLQASNYDGAKSRQEKAFNRVRGLENQDAIQEKLQEAIKDVDLPSVIGIAKRANEKGLDGSANERSMIAVLDAIQDPQAGKMIRQAITKEWLDNLAKANMGDAVVGIGQFKKDRNQIFNYVKKYDQLEGEEGIRFAGTSGQAYYVARKKLTDADPELSKPENNSVLQRKIAHLLASRAVEAGGKTFTVWDQDFTFYRNSVPMKQFDSGNHSPETDYDYSAQESSQILRPGKVYNAILKMKQDGGLESSFSDQSKAFLTKLVKTREDRLNMVLDGKISKNEYLNMMEHVRKNLDSWTGKMIASQYHVQFPKIEDPSGTNKYLMKTLLDKGLVSGEVFLNNMFSDENSSIARTILSNLGFKTLRQFARTYRVEDTLDKFIANRSAEELQKINDKKFTIQ